MQAARGTTSHFNVATQFDGTVFARHGGEHRLHLAGHAGAHGGSLPPKVSLAFLGMVA